MIARTWLRDYLKRNRRTMSAVQIKAVATTARQNVTPTARGILMVRKTGLSPGGRRRY